MEFFSGKMFIRPEARGYEEYTVYRKITVVNARGAQNHAFEPDDPPVVLKLAKTMMRPREIEQFRQMQHPATHKFALKGSIPLDANGGKVIKVGDRLVIGEMEYEVTVLPHEPLNAGVFTVLVGAEVTHHWTG